MQITNKRLLGFIEVYLTDDERKQNVLEKEITTYTRLQIKGNIAYINTHKRQISYQNK